MLTATLLGAVGPADAAGERQAVDYVVTMNGVGPLHGALPEYRVFHHRGRLRTDRAAADVVASVYETLGDPAQISDVSFIKTGVRQLHIQRFSESEVPAPSKRIYTGETPTILGEPCRMWRSSVHIFGCTARDGVELWRKDSSEWIAVKVERQPVSAGAVAPPLEQLAIAHWVGAAALREVADRDVSGDYEVVLDTDDAPRTAGRTIRRSGDWRMDSSSGPQAYFALSNPGLGFGMQTSSANGSYSALSIGRGKPGRSIDHAIRLPSSETVLGERCQWVDLYGEVLVSDVESRECRTVDGIVLRTEHANRGGRSSMTAIRLQRRRVNVVEVLPPAIFLSPETWLKRR